MGWIPFWTPPPDEYLALIGRFIVSMSYSEAYLKKLLWQATGMSEELGALMFGGAGVDEVTSLLKRYFDRHSTNQFIVDDLEDIIKELLDLKTYRDHMAHRQWKTDFDGSVSSPDDWVKIAKVTLSHKLLAKSAELIEETPYTLADLEKLCVRAHIAMCRLLRFLMRHQSEAGIRGLEAMLGSGSRFYLPPAPWLGKSRPREKAGGKSPRSSRKHSLPHRSSRGKS